MALGSRAGSVRTAATRLYPGAAVTTARTNCRTRAHICCRNRRRDGANQGVRPDDGWAYRLATVPAGGGLACIRRVCLATAGLSSVAPRVMSRLAGGSLASVIGSGLLALG